MALIGIKAEDVEDANPVEVWPENWKPMQVLLAMETQWRFTYGQATGLDYAVLNDYVYPLCGVRKKERDDVLAALQVMEREALKQMADK